MTTRQQAARASTWGMTLAIWGIMLLLGLGLFEVALRVSPGLISLPFLAKFDPGLRTAIAAATGLATAGEYRFLKSADRKDKGRDIALFEPNASYLWPADAADREAGALEVQTSDPYGFCNPKGAFEAAPVDVLVLGGSVPSCTGVQPDQTFAAQLGKVTGLKTYNMTVGGTGPDDYVEVLRAHGLALKPRMVVMAYAESNDVRDCKLHKAFVAAGNTGKTARPASALNPMRYSYALNFIYAGGSAIVKSAKRSAAEDFRFSATVQGQPFAFNIRNGDLDELALARELLADPAQAAACRPALEEFVALARANAFIPVVMLVPAAYTAYGSTTRFNDPAIAPAMAALHTVQRDWLSQEATGIGYIFVDETMAFTAAIAQTPPAFFPSNVHFSAAGQATLAQTHAAALTRLLGPQ